MLEALNSLYPAPAAADDDWQQKVHKANARTATRSRMCTAEGSVVLNFYEFPYYSYKTATYFCTVSKQPWNDI
jgi:hypothetical protein